MSWKNRTTEILYYVGLCIIGLLSFLAIILVVIAVIHENKILINTNNIIEKTFINNLFAQPEEKSFYETAFSFADRKKITNIDNAAAIIVPHHLLAADIIAEQYRAIKNNQYDTIVLIGPNHFNAGEDKIVTALSDWRTPYGDLKIDHSLAKQLVKYCKITIDDKIFAREHAINSQVAFIKKIQPNAKFLPLILKSTVTKEEAEKLARSLYQSVKGGNFLIIASLDFSHNATTKQAEEQDAKTIKIILDKSLPDIYSSHVDSPASLYALVKYNELVGADFILTRNTNAAELLQQPNMNNVTSYITGIFQISATTTNPESADEKIKMLFFGDLMIDRYVKEKINKFGFDYLFNDISENFFNNYDVVSCNLEGAVTNDGSHYYPELQNDFAFLPSDVGQLKNYNFNYFNLANNHLTDQGERGIIETRNNLNKLDFGHFGCPDGEVGECSATTTVLNGKIIGLAGFSIVYHQPQTEKIKKIIASLASTTDLIIVNIHWGVEYNHYFNKKQQILARQLIDAGADVIIGHHPHVAQGIEIYKNKPIFYSLGNFIFDQYFSPDTQQGLSLSFEYSKNQYYITLFPFGSKQSKIYLLSDKEKINFLEKLINSSKIEDEFINQVKSEKIIIKN